MKLQLQPHLVSLYVSDNWRVKIQKVNISSITPTVVPNIGYGGYGWALTVSSKIKPDDIIVDLYKNQVLVNTYKLDKRGKCVVSPNGGTPNEYNITLYKIELKN